MPQSLTPHTLIHDLQADGWRPGPPERLPAEVLMEDIRIYQEMPCDACGACRQRVRPFHRGPEYLLLIQCRACCNCQV